MDVKELKVSKNTEPKKLAGTVKYQLTKGNQCSLMALGQQSICICVKALALLTTMFKIEYACTVSYFNEDVESGLISGIRFDVK